MDDENLDEYAQLAHTLVDAAILDKALNVLLMKYSETDLAAYRREYVPQKSMKVEIDYSGLSSDVPNIQWLKIEEFSPEKGEQKIHEFIKTWFYEDCWLYRIDLISIDELEIDARYRYRVRWSIPTRRHPIPRATASVYFTIEVSKITPKDFPINVYYVIEGNRLVHRPGQIRFEEKWLKDVIETKILWLKEETDSEEEPAAKRLKISKTEIVGEADVEGTGKADIKSLGATVPHGPFTQQVLRSVEKHQLQSESAASSELPLVDLPYVSVGPDVFRVSADITMPSGQHKNPHIVGFKDGTAKFYYQPTEAGHHILQTLYNGIPVPNGTYGFLIHSNKPGAVRACGPGLIGGMSDILTTFSVITKDAGPGDLQITIEGPALADVQWRNEKDGAAKIMYTPAAPGDYKITMLFTGQQVEGSPYVARFTSTSPENQRKELQLTTASTFRMSLSVRETYLPNLSTNIQTSSELEEPMNLKKQSVSDFGTANLSLSEIPSDLQKRWQSSNYKNFLKVMEALLILRDGLGPFVKYIISEFQSEILNKHSIPPEACKTNTCNSKHIKNGKLQPHCSDVCSIMLVEILKAHKSCKSPNNVYWENSNICKWSVDAWEIAKVYMGRGQKGNNNGPENSDSAAVLQLLSNCKRYWKYIPCGDVDKVISKRNAAMHSSTLSFADDQLQESFTLIIDFMQKIHDSLSTLKEVEPVKKEIEKTTDNLKELMNTDFEIFLKNDKRSPEQEELKLLEEVISGHENRLTILEDFTEKVKEIKAVIPLLKMMQHNPDLMAKLESGYQNLICLSRLEERTSSLTELTETTASRVTDIEEDLVDLRIQVETLAVKSHDRTRSQVINHKGHLKNYLDCKRVSLPPKYKPWPDPMINDRWLASVTVIVGSDSKTFESCTSCRRIIDAEHSAASEAYQYLLKHEELFSASDKTVATSDAKEQLNRMLASFGYTKATYDYTNIEFTGAGINFKASVTVNVAGLIQKKLDAIDMKPLDRLQAVASEALKAIGQEVADDAHNYLYSWCRSKGYSIPIYYPETPVETINHVSVISNAFQENHQVEIEGGWHSTKKEAQRSAAELLLTFIRETNLKALWGSIRSLSL